MVRITTARLAAAALALGSLAGLHSAHVQAAPPQEHKVTVCHFDGQGRTHLLSIDESALPAHVRNHGDVEAMLVFTDADGDTFGTGDAELRCDLPERTALRDGDCDDANPDINPEANDIGGNDIDEDCDGADDEVG